MNLTPFLLFDGKLRRGHGLLINPVWRRAGHYEVGRHPDGGARAIRAAAKVTYAYLKSGSAEFLGH